ncbi:hypothetical protein ACFODO_17540 [Acinetobacter sichuanensis]|uniref:Uncharacterized protein n=2 Tax=Acinetobacter TaxID=469 RepID=A0ABV7BHH5_9GAMM|nr:MULTISPECIES: hypothetical protein [Acinetobacter]MDM1758359.1 hypothetical protein [Acinetobacter sp. 256-1]MDM1760854.1 hypothetical protein [Acinetobacter sp. 251-1]QOW44839.1 hypothetical protein G0028_02380 [Acinetobacter piscicola]
MEIDHILHHTPKLELNDAVLSQATWMSPLGKGDMDIPFVQQGIFVTFYP